MSAAKTTTRSDAKTATIRKPAVRKAALSAAAGGAQAIAGPAEAAGDKPAREPAAVLRKKDLVDRVAALSGAKKKTARDAVEATLALMGEALDRGEELNLPPFGKARVNRSRDVAGGTALILKLRRSGKGPGGKAPGKDPLADAGD
jgi:hypothetical protein